VSAVGALSEPGIPALPGLADFKGKTFHSAAWDHAFDLRGKRVAVVGTGASAIQFVPAIQPDVSKMTVFQRTPPWVVPRHDRELRAIERRLLRASPALQWLVRAEIHATRELLAVAFFYPRVAKLVERLARAHLARSVHDAQLREKLTPRYTIGCKRILISNDYYPALTKPNVELVTQSIVRVTETGVVTADGVLHPVDAIIFGRLAPDWSTAMITVTETEMGGPILQAVLRPRDPKKKAFSDADDVAKEAIRVLASLR